MRKLLIFLAAALGSLSFSASALDVVRNGKPLAEIIVAADAHEGVKRAAEDLAFFIKKMTGAELKIVNAPTGSGNRLFVGESKFTRQLGYKLPPFKNSGYDILIGKDYAVLAGKMVTGKPFPYSIPPQDSIYLRTHKRKPDRFPSAQTQKWWDYIGNGQYFSLQFVDNGFSAYIPSLKIFYMDDIGPWYAVSALLESAGIRFYSPYEDGTIIPKKSDLAFPAGRTTKEAAFAHRNLHSTPILRSSSPEGVLWIKRLMGGTSCPAIYQHTSYAIFGNFMQKEKHPELFAYKSEGVLQDGYPDVDAGYPRFSGKAFREACLLYCRKVLDASPGLQAICIGTPDSTIRVDYRDLEVYKKKWKTDDLRQIRANMLWENTVYLAKELKKSHPDKFFFHWKHYDNTLPTNLSPDDPDNIVTALGMNSGQWVLDSTVAMIRKEHLPWAKLNHGRKTLYWDYFLDTDWRHIPPYPVFYTRALQRQTKFIQPYCYGKFIEVPTEKKYIRKDKGELARWNVLQQLMMYVQLKLFWDPDLDMKALLDEYYRLYFGPAAAEMKEFHEFAEAVWSRQESRSVTAQSGFLKEADVAKYFEILERARKKTQPGSVYERRINDLIRKIEPLKKLFASLKRSGPVLRITRLLKEVDPNVPFEKSFKPMRPFVDKNTGEKIAFNATKAGIGISRDGKYLYVAAVCYENRMNELKASCRKNDSADIWNDDRLEIFVDTPERSFFHVAVNPNGAVWDRSTDQTIVARETLPLLWSPKIQVTVKKYDDRWEALIRIPTEDFGKRAPSRQFAWGIDIFRTRMAGKNTQTPTVSALVPVGPGAFARPQKWGCIY